MGYRPWRPRVLATACGEGRDPAAPCRRATRLGPLPRILDSGFKRSPGCEQACIPVQCGNQTLHRLGMLIMADSQTVNQAQKTLCGGAMPPFHPARQVLEARYLSGPGLGSPDQTAKHRQ